MCETGSKFWLAVIILATIQEGHDVEAIEYFRCRVLTSQQFTLDECSVNQVIRIRSADVGFDPMWNPNVSPPCSWQNASCNRSVIDEPYIRTCNGQRTCSFSQNVLNYPRGGVSALCGQARHGNYISIKYDCVSATTTTTTTTATTTTTLSSSSVSSLSGIPSTATVRLSTNTSTATFTPNSGSLTDVSAGRTSTDVDGSTQLTSPCLCSPGTVVGIAIGEFVAGFLLSAAGFGFYIYRTRDRQGRRKSSTRTDVEMHDYYNVPNTSDIAQTAVTSEDNYQTLQPHQSQDSPAVYSQLTPTPRAAI